MNDTSKDQHLVMTMYTPVSEKYEFSLCADMAKNKSKIISFKTEEDGVSLFMMTAKSLSEILESQNDIDGIKKYIEVMSEIMNEDEEDEEDESEIQQ